MHYLVPPRRPAAAGVGVRLVYAVADAHAHVRIHAGYTCIYVCMVVYYI